MDPIDLRDEFANEGELEQYIVDHPDLFFPNWWLVGRQLRTDQGEADLVYVHDERGWLFVVELKLGNVDRRTVGQVAEYAEFLASLTPAELTTHISNSSGKKGVSEIADFATEWSQQYGSKYDFADMPICAMAAGTAIGHATHRTVSRLRLSRGLMGAMLLRGEGDGASFQAYGDWLPPAEPVQWWFPPAGAKRPQLREWVFDEAAKTEAADLHAEIVEMVTTAFPSGRWVPRVDPDSLGLNWAIRGQSGKPVESITVRIYNRDPDQIFLMLFDEVLDYAPDRIRDALQPFIYGEGTRLGKPHGEVRWIDAETWAEHGAALRDALAHAGTKHAQQTA